MDVTDVDEFRGARGRTVLGKSVSSSDVVAISRAVKASGVVAFVLHTLAWVYASALSYRLQVSREELGFDAASLVSLSVAATVACLLAALCVVSVPIGLGTTQVREIGYWWAGSALVLLVGADVRLLDGKTLSLISIFLTGLPVVAAVAIAVVLLQRSDKYRGTVRVIAGVLAVGAVATFPLAAASSVASEVLAGRSGESDLGIGFRLTGYWPAVVDVPEGSPGYTVSGNCFVYLGSYDGTVVLIDPSDDSVVRLPTDTTGLRRTQKCVD